MRNAWSRFTRRLLGEGTRGEQRILLLTALAAFIAAARTDAVEMPAGKGNAESVVLMVWDGMRPDFVTPELTPTLHALAASGTFFARNHSVYITSTEVNGASIATGCFPDRTGIFANREYRPDISAARPFATEAAAAIKLGDEKRNGKYLAVPTLAEIVQRAGFRTAIAGTKPVALLHDRRFDRAASHGSTVVFAGKASPENALPPLLSALGKFPAFPLLGTTAPNTAQNAWTTRALLDDLWNDGVPKFSTLWLGDPDFSQHLTQPGSPTARAAIKDCDANLAAVLTALERKGARARTDVFVVSDHGFSTIERALDLALILKTAGFNVVREFLAPPRSDEVLAVSLGGSAQLYLPQHDPVLLKKLVEFLQASDFAGPIFTREAMRGTFALSEARIETADAPDILFSYRWRDGKNATGVRGLLTAEGRKSGYGTHASLSNFDLHNTLIAAGPHIRAGFRDELPTGNADLAPTILALLGIPAPEAMDGRVLEEALADTKFEAPPVSTRRIEATAPAGSKKWRQYLKFTTLGDRRYLDEGNAGHTK